MWFDNHCESNTEQHMIRCSVTAVLLLFLILLLLSSQFLMDCSNRNELIMSSCALEILAFATGHYFRTNRNHTICEKHTHNRWYWIFQMFRYANFQPSDWCIEIHWQLPRCRVTFPCITCVPLVYFFPSFIYKTCKINI